MNEEKLVKPEFLQNQDLEEFLEEFNFQMEILDSLGSAAMEVGFDMSKTFHAAIRLFGPTAEKVKQYLEYSLQREVIENEDHKVIYKTTAE